MIKKIREEMKRSNRREREANQREVEDQLTISCGFYLKTRTQGAKSTTRVVHFYDCNCALTTIHSLVVSGNLAKTIIARSSFSLTVK